MEIRSIFLYCSSDDPGDHDLTRLTKTAALLDADECLIISRSSQRIEGRAVAALNLTASVELLLAQ